MTGTLLTTVEVAERLGLSSAAVAQAVRTGALQPSARTNDDFLFTERTIAAYAERRAQAAASPLPPPAAGTRSEWEGDVGRLNSWLKELTQALPVSVAGPAELPPTAEAKPVAVGSEPEAPAPAPIAAKSLLERIAASELAVSPAAAMTPLIEAKPPAPRPEPAPVVWPDLEPEEAPEPVAPSAATAPELSPDPRPVPAPAAEAVTVPVPEVPAQVAAAGSHLSRQAVLVVQPVVRFRVLRDVAERLATVAGVSDARLERLEGGVASYRVSFHGEPPSPEAIGGPLADLNLEVMLVESSL